MSATSKFANALIHEQSPYLLQHAHNPVDWMAWSASIFELAEAQNKPILLSIGYAACHWCHVMERESFEDEEVAKYMNEHFINIKVDREESPDVDAIYMKAIQIMTGRGGWPLNVVALPDGRPVWGGTYFRKEEWISTLEKLNHIYQSNPEKMIEYAEKLQLGINSRNFSNTEITSEQLNQNCIEPLIEKWRKSFDLDFGGMARAPKFMMPINYKFLMRQDKWFVRYLPRS